MKKTVMERVRTMGMTTTIKGSVNLGHLEGIKAKTQDRLPPNFVGEK